MGQETRGIFLRNRRRFLCFLFETKDLRFLSQQGEVPRLVEGDNVVGLQKGGGDDPGIGGHPHAHDCSGQSPEQTPYLFNVLDHHAAS